MSLD
jgi:hypothetical protein